MAARSREAISTIKGYYYQFDYFILQLLQLSDDDDSVLIEGIEDVDILADGEIKAVQCKFYEDTKCSPSVVAKAVRPMLCHFAKNRDAKLTYRLYGHYNSGEDSITLPLSVDYVKEKFFTYTEKKTKHILHEELGLSDEDLGEFLERLTIQLYADGYGDQIEKIITRIRMLLHCTEYDARFFYYNNAVAFVKDVAVKKSAASRKVTKRNFLEAICKKKALFDAWYIESIGFEKYYKSARKQYFTQVNISPKNRFFLIECDSLVDDVDIANFVMKVSEKWSRLSLRERLPFCPFIYLHGLSSKRLGVVKRILLDNDFHIWDGHEYKDADFSAESLLRPVSYHTGIKARIINKLENVEVVLDKCQGAKEVYEFYVSKPFFKPSKYIHKQFQMQNSVDILKIV